MLPETYKSCSNVASPVTFNEPVTLTFPPSANNEMLLADVNSTSGAPYVPPLRCNALNPFPVLLITSSTY